MLRNGCIPILSALLVSLLVNSSPLKAQETITFDWQLGDGPADIGDDLAEISLTDQYLYLDRDDTRRLMEYLENPLSEQEIATIAPISEDEQWLLVFEWDPIGYVDDDDREELDADAILEALRAGNESANEVRRQRGWVPLTFVGWKTPPFYDVETNNLTWATLAESEGSPILNRNIRLLGRKGVMNVTVVASPEEYETAVAESNQLLDSFRFKPGNRYAEYVAGRDRAAEIGLTALITGGATAAAIKTGLFARFWKFIAAGAVALFAGIRRVFGRFRGSEPKPRF